VPVDSGYLQHAQLAARAAATSAWGQFIGVAVPAAGEPEVEVFPTVDALADWYDHEITAHDHLHEYVAAFDRRASVWPAPLADGLGGEAALMVTAHPDAPVAAPAPAQPPAPWHAKPAPTKPSPPQVEIEAGPAVVTPVPAQPPAPWHAKPSPPQVEIEAGPAVVTPVPAQPPAPWHAKPTAPPVAPASDPWATSGVPATVPPTPLGPFDWLAAHPWAAAAAIGAGGVVLAMALAAALGPSKSRRPAAIPARMLGR
jgi:hypothetical protein